jgi:hypothetical protein
VQSEFGSWKIQSPDNLGQFALEGWKSYKPARCPGIAVGRFLNQMEMSYAVLLVPKAVASRGHRFVLFSKKAGEKDYSVTVLDQSNDETPAFLYIRKESTKDSFSRIGRDTYKPEATDCILFVASGGSVEGGTEVYFWTRGHFQHASVD